MQPTSSSSQPPSVKVSKLVGAGILTKFMIDSMVQMFHPFLTIFAAGLGLNAVTMGRVVSLRSFMGLLAPLFGALADRFGYRRVIQVGMYLSGLGLLLMAMSRPGWMLIIAMMAMGIGTALFTPSLQAYLSSHLPYERRARYLGMVEYSWALAGIVGMFVMGQLIALINWQAPLVILGLSLVVASLFLSHLLYIPEINQRQAIEAVPPLKVKPVLPSTDNQILFWTIQARQFFDLGPNRRSAWAVIAAYGCSAFATFHIYIIHGGWFEAEYGLGPAQLGTIALMTGLADLCGSGLVSLITDRLGKRLAVVLGLLGMTVGYMLLPWLNLSVTLAITSLILPRFCFEFAIVSNLSLLSEQVPRQRGKVLSFGMMASLAFTTLTGWSGPWAYANLGVWGLGPVSAVLGLVALGLIIGFVKEKNMDVVQRE